MGLLINGEYVDDEVIRAEANGVRAQFEEELRDVDPVEARMRVWQYAQESVIERTLLRQAALKDETPVDEAAVNEALTRMFPPAGDLESCEPGVTRAGVDREAARAEVIARLKVDRLLERTFENAVKPREKDLLDFYKKNRERFRRGAMFHASHIVKNAGEQVSEEEARLALEKALAELEAGRAFAEVADEVSDCPGQGGELGWFAAGQMVEEFERVLEGLAPGERSGIFRTPFGFHIAMLHDRRPAGIAEFEEVRPHLEDMFERQAREFAVRQLMQELRAGAEVRKAKGPQAVTA
jgi:hypothetical protein